MLRRQDMRLAVPAGDSTLIVTRTAQDQTTAQAQASVTRPPASRRLDEPAEEYPRGPAHRARPAPPGVW